MTRSVQPDVRTRLLASAIFSNMNDLGVMKIDRLSGDEALPGLDAKVIDF